ncbi:MAG TPA: mechanosensitive ion channel domain-containing protein [Candidatus Limnocylindrales bacterium]|nr:mechanosensitive ion channel domain-containing protein [Candidatus Limnocylindrales bacterium]
MRSASARAAALVDTRELDTAQQLAQLAVTHREDDYAQQALQLADHAVDTAFDIALRDATDNPPPQTPETGALAARIKTAEAAVDADHDRLSDLQAKLAKARPSEKDNIQEQIDLVQAQSSLDQDELTDAHEDLIRAGGDKRAIVQKQLDQHEASETHGGKMNASALAANAASSPEATPSTSIVAESRAFFSLRNKEALLEQAKANALSRQAALTSEHESLEKQMDQEKAERRILRRRDASAAAAPSQVPAVSGANATTAAASAAAAESPAQTSLELLRHLTTEQRDLSSFDKAIEDEEALAANYGNWLTFVGLREKAFLHGIFVSIFWILLIAVGVLLANYSVQRFFSDVTPERRELHTMRTVALVVTQALGVALILLVVFGVPNNFATFLALATAGVTVAMKDFIVGFVGWFVLMGKDGIRPGDWVEINGVGGEVLEVGLFRTVLLETGNWSDAAHPTGRKVAFVNSFAIEGHYFNFSTSGQWLWDELQIQVPANLDPYPTAEAIQKIAADETAPNSRQAEEEWTRVVPAYAKKSFSAAPSMSVKPTGGGVNVTVRYITRARDRQEVRGRLYRAIVELLHRKESHESEPPVSTRVERK